MLTSAFQAKRIGVELLIVYLEKTYKAMHIISFQHIAQALKGP